MQILLILLRQQGWFSKRGLKSLESLIFFIIGKVKNMMIELHRLLMEQDDTTQYPQVM
jgi:hypothetical protein